MAGRCRKRGLGSVQPIRRIGLKEHAVDAFCASYMQAHGGRIDYIHGDDEAVDLAAGDGCCGILMPRMEKEELFTSVLRSGPFPKKSFSIGLGADKRYYLECRKL